MENNKLIIENFQKSRCNFFHKSTSKKLHTKPSISGSNSDNFLTGTVPITLKDKEGPKKIFDKNKWRLEKYSRKRKLENWNGKRNEFLLHRYRKEQGRDKNAKFDVKRIYEEEERRAKEENGMMEGNTDMNEHTSKDPQKSKTISKSHEACSLNNEQKQKREEFHVCKAKRQEAINKYNKEKIEKYKKINRKTKKGQPIMKGRLEYLLEKIQKNVV